MPSIADLRKEYAKSELDILNVSDNPVDQFENWFQEALKAELIEPNAMTVATVNEHGKPSCRVILLKGIENRKFVFYTNYQGRKSKELEHNPACALTFFWPELERQVRIEGIAERIEEKRSIEYFQSRPRASQIGAWCSPQSAIIESRDLLYERALQIEKKFEGQPILPKPQQWGGFEVEPLLIEFWQGRPARLHDRIEYTFVDGNWKVHRLAP